jgi:hypothetical protein
MEFLSTYLFYWAKVYWLGWRRYVLHTHVRDRVVELRYEFMASPQHTPFGKRDVWGITKYDGMVEGKQFN